MAPGAHGMPPASGIAGPRDGTVDVAGSLAGYLSGLPPRRVLLVRLALRAFEWSPFPWRFSRSGLEARQDFLRRMDESHSWLRQDMLLLLKVLTGSGYANDRRVLAASGSTTSCRVESNGAGTAAAPAPLRDLAPRGEGEDCDVAIIGSGAGGAVAAAVLAEAGLDVLVIEAGPYMDRDSYPIEPLEALSALYRDGGLTIAEGMPAIPTPVGRAVGGTTVINSGTCFRAPDEVLARWRDEHGVEWARDLDADYATAEELLAVTAVDPETMGRNGQLLLEGAEAMGVSRHPLRRNAGRCVECSSCPYGCRLDAKRAMHVTYLPRAIAAGARVRSGVEARRVVFEGERATGIDCVRGVADPLDSRPRGYQVRARRAVV